MHGVKGGFRLCGEDVFVRINIGKELVLGILAKHSVCWLVKGKVWW